MADAADPPRDFERMLNPAPAEAGVDRSTLIKDFVDEMEGRMREVEGAQVQRGGGNLVACRFRNCTGTV
jgi:hypothetical protein